ncbi:uncharacterized protein LOC115758071 [Drosophila novamexicana]|uniref:uncharacterized protein LOC115758071 n=1 Tax=Drosophila novamexicana TaxID=47314 RepID=UPI0011E5B798|nr:uncharacterized protein LOC115758071 [Drosophila novamexicana]
MKLILALSALLAILSSALVAGQVYNLSSLIGSGTSSNTPRICVLSNCNYYSNSNVCGRYGRSNLCMRFTNRCLLRYEACVNSVTYTTVSLSMCSGIPVGTRRQCAGSTTSSSSTSNVQPIYISRRRG